MRRRPEWIGGRSSIPAFWKGRLTQQSQGLSLVAGGPGSRISRNGATKGCVTSRASKSWRAEKRDPQYNLVSWALYSFGVPLDDFLPQSGP